MAEEYIFVMERLSKSYPGGREVLKKIWLSFFPGAKIGVVGPNGAGKSTLLKIMAGLETEFDGEARLMPGFRAGYLPQDPKLDPDKTVQEIVEEGVAEKKQLLDRFEEISLKLGEEMEADEMDALIAEQGRVQDAIEAAGAWDLDRELEIAMDALRCPPGETSASVLSGGEQRRVALCRILLDRPDLLLLDEPTNHLDAESVAWLEHHLKEYPGTVVVITHDRYFLDNVSEWILELDAGSGVPWKGNYASWLEQKAAKLAAEEKQESARRRTLLRELEWVRLAPGARQERSRHRLAHYEQLLAAREDDKKTHLEIEIPPGPRLGDLVVEARDVAKGYDDRLLFENMSFALPRGGIVGVIGPNGAGKTTLFQMIEGSVEPDSGELTVGPTVVLAHQDQGRSDLDPEKSVWEEISGGADTITLGSRQVASRSYVASFNFKRQDQQKKLGQLSGGELNRLHLAKVLKSGGNLLLLDEPTNDLDVDTLRSLEEGLAAFGGCAVVISHDRWFLDRVATHILAFEGDSEVVWHEGNYQSWEADHRRRRGGDADRPHRPKFKKLMSG